MYPFANPPFYINYLIYGQKEEFYKISSKKIGKASRKNVVSISKLTS
jgi:hypothetical protein